MDAVITILRTPHELRALINRSKYTFVNTSDGNTVEEFASWYTLLEAPLNTLGADINRRYKQLLESWNALGTIQAWDHDCLFHLLIVLLETAPLFLPPERHKKLPPLPFEPPPRKATAKHPRAYRGTTFQPPKTKSLSNLDLRPYVCEPNHLRAVLRKLRPYWDAALTQCARAGYNISGLTSLPLNKLEGIELYYAAHHAIYEDIKPYKLPTEFVTTILPLLQGTAWREVLDTLSIYWGASVHHDPALLSALSKLLSLNHGKVTLEWCRFLIGVPPQRRVMFLTLLIELEVYRVDAAQYSLRNIEQFHAMTPKEHYQHRLFIFLSAIKQRIPAAYMLAGFQLANAYAPSYAFQSMFAGCPSFPYHVVTALIEHVKDTENYHDTFALDIWRACGEFSELADLLNGCCWTEFLPETTFRLLNIYLFFADRWELSTDVLREKWRYLHQHRHALESTLREIPPGYQVKFLYYMHDFYWYWDSGKELQAYVSIAMALAKRLSCPPFSSRKSGASEVLSDFIDCTTPQAREQFLQTPNSSFLNLEKACRSENRAQLITYGMAAMLRELPQFAVACFVSFSGKLWSVAKLLGTLRRPRRHAVVKQFRNHPLMNFQADAFSVREACDLIKMYCQEGITNPIPKKLQAHVYEQYELSDRRIYRYVEKMTQHLYATLLDLLHHQITQELQRHYPSEPEANPQLEHTLQVMSWIDDNRRGFKRFLHEYMGGNTLYLQTHPKTQAWRAKHPRIRFGVWTEGMMLSKVLEKHGSIRIEVEHNPLEALKLGTYMGTCLGVGGLCTYSAAAIVIDDNKHVLYARNRHNTVVARQVVALSEEEQLICFSVYPLNTDRELLALFRDYDRRFAKALGVDPYEGQEDQDYSIRHILSQYWWDDMPWDLSLPEVSEAEE